MNAPALRMIAPDTLPDPRDERWKYTDLASAVRHLPLVPAGAGSERTVDVPAGQEADKSIEIEIAGVDGRYTASSMAVTIGAQAEAVLIERHAGDGRFWNSAAARITLAPGARLRHYRVQEYGAEAVYTQATAVTLARDAYYEAFTLTLGGAMSRHEIEVRLEGEGAHAELNGVSLLQGTQHGDTTILVDHQAPRCVSHQFYRTVLDGRARGVFQGKIHVARPAQKTDGFQLSKALLLSEGAEMDTKPELEIYADDVKCSHGATTGQIDEQALFYMRARGIGLEEARGLLVGAFAGEALEKITDEAVRSAFIRRVESWLDRRE